jgi:putative DNA primase/helicase
MTAINEFRDAIQSAGLIPPDMIEPGKFHRFPGEGKRNGNTAAWCKLFPDGIGGIYGDHSTGFTADWQARRETPYTQAEREVFKRQAAETKAQDEAERKDKQAEAAIKAAGMWKAAMPAPEGHPYLIRKGIKPSGARLHNDALVIPMRAGGEIQSLQFIGPDGDKRFLTGGRVTGCYFSMGNPKGAAALCIAEGFATGATIHEATGYPVAVAFNAGNLGPVAKAMRERFAELPLILCADDDAATEGNPGIIKATEAAQSVSGLVAIPDFGADRPEGATDFNDMAKVCGLEAVGSAIANATTPAMAEPQPGAENAVSRFTDTVELIDGASIKPEAVSWLWEGYLARGKLHVLAGAPGTGKTMIALALAATVSTGGRWPDGTHCEPGNVLIWSAEDDIADTLVPRLIAMGADMHKIRFVGDKSTMEGREPFDPARDMPMLLRTVAGAGEINLLIVDPIVSAVAGDSHKNAEVRRGLQPLVDVGHKLGAAVLGISHFSKGTAGREVTERVTGSLAFGALARVVLAAAKRSEDDGGGRILARAKSNIGPDGGGFAYDLAPGTVTGHPGIAVHVLQWGNAIEGSARELLASAEDAGDPGERNASDDAASWLATLLTEEGGQVDRRAVMRAAQAMGFKERTVHRARETLGLVVVQTGFGKDKRSVWKRGETPMHANSAHACQQNSMANMDKVGTHGAIEGFAGMVEVDV